MQVNEQGHPSSALFHVVALRRERLRFRLGRVVPAARGEHAVGAIEAPQRSTNRSTSVRGRRWGAA